MAVPRQRPRTCVACREESPKRALIRVVRSPEGVVVIDERGKLPGRGAYLCADLGCLEKAQKTRALARALKVEVPVGLYERLGEYIETYKERHGPADIQRELRLLLGLSRRANLVYIGIDSVKSECRKEEKPLLILTASDSSESINEAVRKLAEEAGCGHVHRNVLLSVEDFSLAMGASGVQVAALPGQSGLADKIKMLLS